MANIIKAIRRSTDSSKQRNSKENNSDRVLDSTIKDMADRIKKVIGNDMDSTAFECPCGKKYLVAYDSLNMCFIVTMF